MNMLSHTAYAVSEQSLYVVAFFEIRISNI